MTQHQFQKDLKENFANGSAGALVASVVWLASAISYQLYGVYAGFLVLFFGGNLIFPLSLLVLKGVFKRSANSKGNLGAKIVIETIPPMIVGFFAAWILLRYNQDLVIPIATIAVGAHYFGFRSAYGEPLYWLLATVVCMAGFITLLTGLIDSLQLLYLTALIELIFAVILYQRALKIG